MSDDKTTDHRDELILTQRKLIVLQDSTIATLRAYLKAAHDTAQRHERTIQAMQAQQGGKGLQA